MMMRSRARRALVLAVVAAVVAAASAGWRIREDRRPRVLTNPSWRYVGCLRFSLTGETLAIGTGEGTVELWSWREDREEGRIELPPSDNPNPYVYDVSFSSSGRWLATASYEGPARVWSFPQGVLERSIAPVDTAENVVAIMDSGTSVAVPTKRGLEVWPAGGTAPTISVAWSHTVSNGVAFSSRGDQVADCDYDGVAVWSLATGELLGSHRLAPAGRRGTLWASPDDDFLWAEAMAEKDALTVEVRREPSDAIVGRFALGVEGYVAQQLAISPSGDLLAVSLAHYAPGLSGEPPDAAEVQVWSLPEGKRLATFTDEPRSQCQALAFSPTRPLLAAAWGERIHLWPIRR
jgi:WD40 repeat protein